MIFLKASSGAGAEELLLESPFTKLPTDWSLDGRFVLYHYGDPHKGWDLAALPMAGERKPLVVVSGPFEERDGQFSPDGRWVAYQSNESGRFEICVQPFPGPGDKVKVSIAGGTDPRWHPDGQELFFLAPDTTLMAAAVRASGSAFDAGVPTALFQTRVVVGGNANLFPQYAVSRDGRFLINVPDETSPAERFTNAQLGLHAVTLQSGARLGPTRSSVCSARAAWSTAHATQSSIVILRSRCSTTPTARSAAARYDLDEIRSIDRGSCKLMPR